MAFDKAGSSHSKDPEFVRNRPRVLARDMGQCQLAWDDCEVRATEVDHIKNFKSGGMHAMDNLQAVCNTCHKQKTQKEAARAWAKIRRDATHPDSRLQHPGLRK